MTFETYDLLILFFLEIITDDESEFTYDEESEKGPSHWGEIHSEWSMCNSGKLQSPIDLLNERVEVVSHLGRLRRSYKPSNSTLLNRGHDMMVRKKEKRDSTPFILITFRGDLILSWFARKCWVCWLGGWFPTWGALGSIFLTNKLLSQSSLHRTCLVRLHLLYGLRAIA